jgi:hypothetical protein
MKPKPLREGTKLMSDKVYVTYHAPEGDSKVCEMGGKTFFDGQAIELDSEADAALIEQCSNNAHFEVSGHKGVEHKAAAAHHSEKGDHDPDSKPKPDHRR